MHRFSGKEYRFLLSQKVFSSFEIDRGSRLLLNAVEPLLRSGVRSVYDIGCGVGVLGIVAGAAGRASRIVMEDRSQIAVAVSRQNALRNKVSGLVSCVCVACGADSADSPRYASASEAFELVLSNIPAKAGAPVRRFMIEHALRRCCNGGTVGLVVVPPIAGESSTTLRSAGATIISREDFASHTVFVARPGTPVRAQPRSTLLPAAYVRTGELEKELSGTRYRVRGVWGLPEFDECSYTTEILARLISENPPKGGVVFWKPGVGHLPAWLHRRKAGEEFVLASDDALELAASVDTVSANAVRSSRSFPSSTLLSSPREIVPLLHSGISLVIPLEHGESPATRDALVELVAAGSRAGVRIYIAGSGTEVVRIERARVMSASRRVKGKGGRGIVAGL